MITLPFNFSPRDYQLNILRALDSGIKRAIWIVHRRAGKDLTMWNYTIKKAVEKVGVYYYILPYYAQARKIIWEGIHDGISFLSHIPQEIIASKQEQSMTITLVNGSHIKLVGSDQIDTIVGTNPIGIVFSEFALQKPEAWELMRPILAENGGWAVFITTPRGRNHAYKMLNMARGNSDWFSEVLSVYDTNAIEISTLEKEKQQMRLALFEQEYECKFDEGASQLFRDVRRNMVLPTGQLSGRYIMGIDFGRKVDQTVITILDAVRGVVVEQDCMDSISWELQEARILSSYHKYKPYRIIYDATGIGDVVGENLRRLKLPVNDESAFIFTEKSRKELLDNLAVLQEKQKIIIPIDDKLAEQLEGFIVSTTDNGRIVYESTAPHDDKVMSLALACKDFVEPKARPVAGLHHSGTMMSSRLSFGE